MADEKTRFEAASDERRRRREEFEKGKEARERRTARLRVAADEVLKTEAGQLLWAELFRLCGYNESSLSHRADGEVAELATEAKEAQRFIYLRMRELASPELLAAAEFYAEYEKSLPIPQKERKA